MLTELTNSNEWLTLTQLASRACQSKQALSKWINKHADLLADGIQRDAGGRLSKINYRVFQQARGQYVDVNMQRGKDTLSSDATSPVDADTASLDVSSKNDSLAEAQRRDKWLAVQLKETELAEKCGQLVPRETVERVAATLVAIIGGQIDRLHLNADDVARAVAAEGHHGCRSALKDLSQKLRQSIEGALIQALDKLPDEASSPSTNLETTT